MGQRKDEISFWIDSMYENPTSKNNCYKKGLSCRLSRYFWNFGSIFLKIFLGGVIAKKLPFVVYPTPVENQDQRSGVIYFQILQALDVAYTDFQVIWPPVANFKRALLINSFSWLFSFFSQGQANILASFTKMKPCTRNIAKTRMKGIFGSHSNI